MIDTRLTLELIVNKRQPQDLILRLVQKGGKEANFKGYKPIALAGSKWVTSDGAATYPEQEFRATTDQDVQHIVGWSLTAGQGVVVSRTFADSVPIRTEGSAVRISPSIKARDLGR